MPSTVKTEPAAFIVATMLNLLRAHGPWPHSYARESLVREKVEGLVGVGQNMR